MALHIIVEAEPEDDRRYRAEVDPHDGWTRLFEGARRIASAWFCPPDRWERIDPDHPAVRSALARVADTLNRLGFSPVQAHESCEIDGDDCEAV